MPADKQTILHTERLLDQLVKVVSSLEVVADLHGREAIRPISKSILTEAITLLELARRVS